jgi:hypothetical protein
MRMAYFRRYLICPSALSGDPARGRVRQRISSSTFAPGCFEGEHPNTLLPIAWYRHLIESSGLLPVFMGQLADDPTLRSSAGVFPAACFVVAPTPRRFQCHSHLRQCGAQRQQLRLAGGVAIDFGTTDRFAVIGMYNRWIAGRGPVAGSTPL